MIPTRKEIRLLIEELCTLRSSVVIQKYIHNEYFPFTVECLQNDLKSEKELEIYANEGEYEYSPILTLRFSSIDYYHRKDKLEYIYTAFVINDFKERIESNIKLIHETLLLINMINSLGKVNEE